MVHGSKKRGVPDADADVDAAADDDSDLGRQGAGR
jgi:hypothetical protein